MVSRAVIVIGSSYGDEGKGLAAAEAARRCGGPTLNILINGGAQRGHTVDLPDGRRHVFRHFGSAALEGAVSLADRDFMVNPMVFVQELQELREQFPEKSPRLLVSENCRVTTVYDMMVNQILEDARGNQRHGSCGLGIYETRRRYEQTDWALDFGALSRLTAEEFRSYCLRIAREYIPRRLAAEHTALPEDWKELLGSEGLIRHSWEDLRAMAAETEAFRDWKTAAAPFATLIFEAGQGLALDEFNLAASPHLTPSRTTSFVSASRIAQLGRPVDTEVVYVTRSYLTRHGAGPLPTECPMSRINPEIVDLTNMPNPYQQTLRYGTFEAGEVLSRIRADREATRQLLPQARFSALVTHLNETGGEIFGNTTLREYAAHFDRVWISASKYSARPLDP